MMSWHEALHASSLRVDTAPARDPGVPFQSRLGNTTEIDPPTCCNLRGTPEDGAPGGVEFRATITPPATGPWNLAFPSAGNATLAADHLFVRPADGWLPADSATSRLAATDLEQTADAAAATALLDDGYALFAVSEAGTITLAEAEEVEGLPQPGEDPQGECLRLVLGRPLGEDGELVATEAGDGVGLTEQGLEPVAGLADELVAGRVAEGVVHVLEVVEVEEEEVHRVAASRT